MGSAGGEGERIVCTAATGQYDRAARPNACLLGWLGSRHLMLWVSSCSECCTTSRKFQCSARAQPRSLAARDRLHVLQPVVGRALRS